MQTTLTSRIDGAKISAVSAQPKGAPIGGVVVIQEIFGVTDHIGEMCTVFADAGYAAIAPSLFDRIEPGFHAEHDQDGVQKGIKAVMQSPWPQVVSDIQAAIDVLPQPVYVTGFCYGGAAAWMAAAQCTGLKAASCFYGRLIADLAQNAPQIPVMLHYGAQDKGIPPENYEDAFRPFSRLDAARNQNVSGVGLGLTIARDTARAHGGDITLGKSELGGLRATIRLPLAERPAGLGEED